MSIEKCEECRKVKAVVHVKIMKYDKRMTTICTECLNKVIAVITK